MDRAVTLVMIALEKVLSRPVKMTDAQAFIEELATYGYQLSAKGNKKFSVGQKIVRVNKSYDFPGEVRGYAETKRGLKRVVCEATGRGYEGMLHIFSEEELEDADFKQGK